jgi:hypothetical protein
LRRVTFISREREREREKITFFLSRLTACHALVSLLGGPEAAELRWGAERRPHALHYGSPGDAPFCAHF